MLPSNRCAGPRRQRVREPLEPPQVEVDVVVRGGAIEQARVCGQVITTVSNTKTPIGR